MREGMMMNLPARWWNDWSVNSAWWREERGKKKKRFFSFLGCGAFLSTYICILPEVYYSYQPPRCTIKRRGNCFHRAAGPFFPRSFVLCSFCSTHFSICYQSSMLVVVLCFSPSRAASRLTILLSTFFVVVVVLSICSSRCIRQRLRLLVSSRVSLLYSSTFFVVYRIYLLLLL